MKIQCDVCEKEEATLFCSADEAVLCDGCDRRVHWTNKLASKHNRYSLLHPTFKDSPLCDICQERRALLFCQEDRAILCRECDIPIHRANEHTQKHSRFLLAGVKLSPSTSPAAHYPQPLLPSSSATTSTGLCRQESSSPQGSGFVNPTFEVGSSGGTGAGREEENQMMVSDGGSMSTSSISEYLMETLPGWRVDEFLDCSHHLSHHHAHHHHNNNNNSSSSNGYYF
ncbi:B-box zinc finger protein 20 isoform X2 [Punica granatum]|uniref:B-box zinc finger protein 20 isoform X2 n=1 Tax=Punica granatum TaxID=22663 RepID=A0A6P8DK69_PUNGR|nr:B-box zinc finger protein 20 isoform X2 [Punica granatum]